MHALQNGHLHVDAVNRQLHWKKTQIRDGFKFAFSRGAVYVPVDLLELIIEFTVKKNLK